MIVDVATSTHRIEHRLVGYDHDEVVRRIDEVHHPAGDFLKRFHLPGE